ncbi:MAG: 50S ribosomal protein L21e [Candidatus Heimdallarchaeota archaeon]|nr:50S ribosomal protein L21e [Candidatus Heimdallarchaeota archaeon]
MRKSSGYRHGTRHLLRKNVRERGMRPLDYLLSDFSEGDVVDVILDSAEHKGMPHRRFHGKTGRVLRKQGKAYVVLIKQGQAMKQITARKEHLRLSRSVIHTTE